MSPSAGLIEPFDDAALSRAAALLRSGGLVAFPTETVYGLGADARDDRAVARVFAAKGRPQFNPLIVHTQDLEAAAEIAELSAMARAVAERFWPGPLTLVARRLGSISDLAAAGLDTVAVRVPAPERTRRLIEAAGGAVAAPSANPSGRLSPTDAAAVAEGLGDAVDLILDGGPCAVGVESTIIAVTEPGPRLLREGGVPREALEAALEAMGAPALKTAPPAQAAPEAPGMLSSHYAPAATLR
ncbi:MAG: L-threonylcarbamoyladenylate synthase, partial [Pseudomonadota bacterium]